MSLVLAAKHLESQGRHGDSQLVHMSTGEVKALRGLAQIHGGDLTINPKTGLPEAGFLSSILPTVAGIALSAAFPEVSPWLIAGGVGLTSAAISGDIGQGLMAGLGAWSGASLAGDVTKLGTQAATQAGQDVATKSFQDSLAQAGGAASDKFVPSLLQSSAPTTATDLATAQMNSFNAAFNPAQQKAYSEAIRLSGGDPNTLSQIVGSAGSANAANLASASPFNTFSQGLTEVGKDPWGFVKANKADVFGTAMPFVTGALDAFQPKTTQAQADQVNPFGLKTLSSDFKGRFPNPPSPHYQAQYRNYVTNPYIPTAAHGGLQSIPKYAGTSDSLTVISDALSKKADQAPIVPSDPGAPYGGPGIVEYEKEYEGMSPLDRTQAKLQSLLGKKNVIKSIGSLGAISTDPALVAIKAIEDEKAKTKNSKEGGLQNYALGGLSMGNLGGYSDGGRLLKGPGDGVSDSIPASIGHKQPARLAEGEFVIPARIVSELGNGSTDAGAKRLYAMMDRIKAKRAKSKDIAADTKTYNLLPA